MRHVGSAKRNGHEDKCWCGKPAKWHAFYGSGCGVVCGIHRRTIERAGRQMTIDTLEARDVPENWTKLPEGYELTFITRTADGSHPRPLCGFAVNLPGHGWCSDCTEHATHGYRNPARHPMNTNSYDDYACDKHLDAVASVVADEMDED